jgi:hypothetical protein
VDRPAEVGAVVVLATAMALLGAAGAFLPVLAPPWSVVAALVPPAVLLVWLALSGTRRPVRLVLALAWVAGAVATTQWDAGGDLVLPDVAAARWYLYGGSVLVLVLALVPVRRRRPSPPASDGDPFGR